MSPPGDGPERVDFKSQSVPMDDASHHDISQLALEFLLQRLTDNHTTNVHTQLAALLGADNERALFTSAIQKDHTKENGELDNIKFTLYDQFHARREALVAASQVEAHLLANETAQHFASLKAAEDNKRVCDEEAEEELQKSIRQFEALRDAPVTV